MTLIFRVVPIVEFLAAIEALSGNMLVPLVKLLIDLAKRRRLLVEEDANA